MVDFGEAKDEEATLLGDFSSFMAKCVLLVVLGDDNVAPELSKGNAGGKPATEAGLFGLGLH